MAGGGDILIPMEASVGVSMKEFNILILLPGSGIIWCWGEVVGGDVILIPILVGESMNEFNMV